MKLFLFMTLFWIAVFPTHQQGQSHSEYSDISPPSISIIKFRPCRPQGKSCSINIKSFLNISLDVTAPAHFVFNECEFTISEFPSDMQLTEETGIRIMRLLEQEQCGKCVMKENLEMEMVAGRECIKTVIHLALIEEYFIDNLFYMRVGVICVLIFAALDLAFAFKMDKKVATPESTDTSSMHWDSSGTSLMSSTD